MHCLPSEVEMSFEPRALFVRLFATYSTHISLLNLTFSDAGMRLVKSSAFVRNSKGKYELESCFFSLNFKNGVSWLQSVSESKK